MGCARGTLEPSRRRVPAIARRQLMQEQAPGTARPGHTGKQEADKDTAGAGTMR
jgi:hypothetical protein